MRTLFLLVAAILLVGLSQPAPAQSWSNQISVTAGVQFPAGNFGDSWENGRGVNITYYSRPTRRLFVGFRGGVHRFSSKPGNATLTIVPIHVATKYNLALSGLQPYLGLNGGLYLPRQEGTENPSELGIAPQIGFRIPIATGIDIDLNVIYEVIVNEPENQSYVGFNAGLAYIFGR